MPDLPHDALLRVLTGHTNAVQALVVAPDGTWLASAAYDATVRIWHPHTGQARHTLTGHTRGVQALVVAPDGSWLASAGYDSEVRIWDPQTGQARHPLTGHTNVVQALVVAPDGTWLASAADGEVRIWNIDPPRCRMSFRAGHALRLVVTDGRWVAVGGDRGPYFLASAAC
jgi:WD40 repeat protein